MTAPAPNLGAPHPGAPSSAGLVDADLATSTEAAPGKKRRKGFGWGFWLAATWLIVVLICAVFADILPVKDPFRPDVINKLALPNSEALLGTDGLGRDTLARLVHGARVSVVISVTAVTIGMVLGGFLGIISGFFRGKLETVLMTIINIILAFPALILLLVLLAFVGRSLVVISLIVGFLSIPIYTRVARATTLAVAEREFVRAARTMGAKNSRVLAREILPNVVLPVAAFGLVAMGVVIVLEGTLAFLGLSVEQPTPTWGGMIFDGKRYLNEAPHAVLIPSLAMFLTVLSLNLVGDSLRSKFDVRGSNL
ncbi:ABC transporter permease [Candidatus Blastococcus massiliensis]|uniref:ABC transporter permease n=1 Tax=Candidatus Blastococcus massiliensis TaxID=1470358 RepID=UPI0004AE2598|nr:ABC transporter permease [Candidatus Blastococcus massiliensis]